jgi:hypothetical protein
VPATFSTGASPATRKSQSFFHFDENSNLFLIVMLPRFSAPFTPHSRPTQCPPLSAPVQALQLAKRNHASIMTNTINSFLIDILLRLNALFTPFYTPNAVHATFSIGTSPATHKTQSFVDLDKKFYFVPD